MGQLKKIACMRESYMILATVILWLVISLMNTNFASPAYSFQLIGFNAVYFICALGVLPLMIKGHFDLSVGGMIAAVSVALMAITVYVELPTVLIVLLGMGMGCLLGTLNGSLIALFKISSVIVTLAMMQVYHGFARYAYPNLLRQNLDMPVFSGFVLEMVLIVIMTVLAYYLLRHHPLGRAVYAFGGNRLLAKEKGFKDSKTILFVHGFSGFSAGMVAALYLITFRQASIDAYTGIEFELIMIVIIGGLNILGGYGTVLGTFVAGIFFVMLKSGMVFGRVSVFWQDMIIGAIIIMVVSYDMLKYRLYKKVNLKQGA